jgi:hypothetical protein
MTLLANDALHTFCQTGKIMVPREFFFRERKQYRHDGNESANRNVWRESNKAQQDKQLNVPKTYHHNTISH